MARERDEWLTYAVVAGILYWLLTRPTVVAQPPASGPVITSSSTGQPLLLPAGNPNNLVSVATPEEAGLIPQESSAMIGVGGLAY